MARITTATNANLLLDVFHAKKFVETLRRKLIVLPLADSEIAPDYSGDVIRWQFFANPVEALTALTEGADPASRADLATTAVTATILEYGDYFELSKLFMKVAASGTKEAFVKAAAYQAALTLDSLCYTLALQDSTNINDAGTAMDAETLRLSVQELESNDAMPHPASPGGEYFCGVFSPEACYDMMGEGAPTWFQAKSNDYKVSLQTPFDGTPANAALYNTIIKKSTNIRVVSSEDLNYVISGNSFGGVSIDSNLMDPSVIITNPEQLVNAPLRNRGTIGWHVMFAAELFDVGNRTVEVKSDQT